MTLLLPSNTLYSLEDFDEDYDFGIDKDGNANSMAIHFVETSTGTIVMKSGEMENPFFVSVFGGSLQSMEWVDILNGYKRAFILCMKNDFIEDESLFQITNQIVKISDFYSIGKQFILLPVSLAILRNSIYKSRGCVVDKVHLVKMFGKNNYDINEIVIPLVEQTENTAKKIISLYDSNYGVKDIEEILAITSHYNKNYKKPVINQLASHLASLKESQFWTDPRNCEINMTDEFMGRSFNYRDPEDEGERAIFFGSDEKISNDVDKVINVLSENKKKDTDYLNFIHTSGGFTDVATSLKNSDKRTYFIPREENNKLDVTEAQLTEIVCQIDNVIELYHTFNSLIKSKEYCHMMLNNEKILNKVKPLFDKYGPVYKYLLGYTWQCFTIEESLMKTKSTKKNRYVFDINTANKLPVFPFIIEDLTQNPYITIQVNQKVLSPMTNAMSLNCIENFQHYYGVCNLEQFKWRFNLFTSGNPAVNIFSGLDSNSYAVSGSVIPACLMKKSPLFDLVSLPNQREEDKWLTFFNHYYGESDIDIMCNDQSIYGFTSKSVTVVDQIKKNTPNYKEGDIEIEPIKTMIVLVSKFFFEEKLKHFNEYFNNDYTSKDMESKLTTDEMREYLYSMYFEYKSKINGTIRREKKDKNPYIKSFMVVTPINEMKLKQITRDVTKQQDKILDSDACFYINDFRSADNKVPEDKNFLVMKIGESIKFKIKSKKTKTIELFRSKTADFFGMVARFHLPCVRAYYQGDNVYILPSCITAMMTGVNIDYKYFACVRDPIDIINKYRMRGFGILLSDQEKKHMAYYNNHVKTFGGMFHVAETDKTEINKMFGPREINDKIYKPLVHTQNLSSDVYTKINFNYIKTIDDLKRYYKTKYGYDEKTFGFNLFTIKTISDIGSINPLKDWVAKEYLSQVTPNTEECIVTRLEKLQEKTTEKVFTHITQLAKPLPVKIKLPKEEKPIKVTKKNTVIELSDSESSSSSVESKIKKTTKVKYLSDFESSSLKAPELIYLSGSKSS
jgi:hypothetical protein